MTDRHPSPAQAATEVQGGGSDPARSVFVVASAGSGKTKVLRDRVLRLMLEGDVEPRRILCLTFTKAAAAEMSNRIQRTLAGWAAKSDDALHREILELTGSSDVDEVLLSKARRLFARVLDTPGGMRIHTIHAFCQSLLRRFPLEAGIAPHFDVIEERDAAEAMDEAERRMLAAAHSGRRPDLAHALADAARRMHQGRIGELLREILGERARIGELMRGTGGIDAVTAAIAALLGLPPAHDKAAIVAGACRESEFAADDLGRAVLAMAQGTRDRQEEWRHHRVLASGRSRLPRQVPRRIFARLPHRRQEDPRQAGRKAGAAGLVRHRGLAGKGGRASAGIVRAIEFGREPGWNPRHPGIGDGGGLALPGNEIEPGAPGLR
jgi:ATP-dependent helicase/nuclease subunit A